MQDTLKIGIIVKPQGIKGEVKIQPLTDDINRFNKLNKVIIDGTVYPVQRAVIGGGMVILALSNITDRNVAETFRGKFICVERKDAVELPKDNYFIVDIIGCKVVTDNDEEVGTVTDVTNAKTDIFTLSCPNNRVLRFPFLKDLVKSVDIQNKLITVYSKRLQEVSCYEN